MRLPSAISNYHEALRPLRSRILSCGEDCRKSGVDWGEVVSGSPTTAQGQKGRNPDVED